MLMKVLLIKLGYNTFNSLGAAFQVPIPNSFPGKHKPVQVRLISPYRTPEMIGACPCGTTWSPRFW